MYQAFPQSPPMMLGIKTKAEAKAVDMRFLLLAVAMIGYMVIFIFTQFPAPLGQFMIQKLRWPALFGVCVVFFLMRKYPVKTIPIVLLAFFASSSLSTFMAEGYMFSLTKLIAMAFSLVLSFYLVPAALSPAQYRLLLALVSVVVCGFGAASIAFGVVTGAIFSLNRYVSLFFGINTEGAYMGFTFFCSLWMWAEFPRSKFRVIFQGLVPAALVACYATGSRSSFFGLMLGVAVWGFTLLVRGDKRRRRQFMIFLSLLGALVIFKWSFFEQGWATLMRNAETSEEFFVSRMWIWEDIWRAFSEKPVLGHGYGISALVTEEKEVSLKTSVSVRDGSGYLGLLESIGLAGCLAFGIMILQLVLNELALLKQGNISPHTVTAHGMSAMIAFLLLNHVGEPWLLGPGSPTFHLFWFYLGAAFYFNHLARTEFQNQKKQEFQRQIAASRARWVAQRAAPLVR